MAERINLNEVYDRLGSLGATIHMMNIKVDALAADIHMSEEHSNKSRATVHRRLDEVFAKTAKLEGSVAAVEKTMGEVQSVTDDVKKMREQARGAGTLGRVLLWLGGFILSGATGFAAAYTWLTGRPPP